jgi:hypothetical protein
MFKNTNYLVFFRILIIFIFESNNILLSVNILLNKISGVGHEIY